jgi:hypothetical protein
MPGGNLAFDEGGVACRSRLCPVRQYNKDKPQKYRVDFFILADSSTYAILHMDVYQGRNSANVNIDSRCLNLPTTMKAVVNACFQTNLVQKTEDGYRTISMDNRYQCPELAVLMMKRFKILSTGTCRRNRKGWRPDLMNMTATTGGVGRGESKMAVDKVNGILLIQWRDSRVVNVVSSILDTTMEETRRQIGRNSRVFTVPRPLKIYHRYMFAVDKGDQSRMHLGGFARKAHFQKWYKKSFFAILDCMLLNSWIGWNMSATDYPHLRRKTLERFEFYEWIYTHFLEYEEEIPAVAKMPSNVNELPVCRVIRVNPDDRDNKACVVCRLDSRYSGDRQGMKKDTFFCVTCDAYVHTYELEEKREIHKHFPQHSSCHDIAKCEGGAIWTRPGKGRRTLRFTHPVVVILQDKYGKVPKNRKRGDGDGDSTRTGGTEDNFL